ncbi:MAG: pyridoxamine kinase [Oscillospiraceae bacterium]|jgi:pyridoxine kinase
MNDTIRIAAVHDLSGFGKCSLTVALPILSASGVECACIPTALLSTHTGGFTGYTFKDLSDEMLPIARHWKKEGVHFDGIYSGYLANPAQAGTLAEIIDLLADDETKIIVDPVMADDGKYYANFGDDMAQAFKQLCRRATILTPNVTEASFITGLPYRAAPHDEAYLRSLTDALGELAPDAIIAVTGAAPEKNSVGVYAVDRRTGENCLCVQPVREGAFHGTGDIFASAFAALMVRGASLRDSAEAAISLVCDSIDRTVARETPRRNGVDFEGALPTYVARVEKLFSK